MRRRLLRPAEASQFSSLIARNFARAAQQLLASAQLDAEAAAALCGGVVRAYLQSPLRQDVPQASPAPRWLSTRSPA